MRARRAAVVRFFVTFGQQYRREHHPRLPAAHPDGVVEILAADEAEARSLAFEYLGDRWAFLYVASECDMSFYPRGVLLTITSTGAVAR